MNPRGRRKPPPEGDPRSSRPPRWFSVLSWLALLGVLGWVVYSTQESTAGEMPYSELKQHLAEGELERVVIGPAEIEGVIHERADDGDDAPERTFEFHTVRVEDPTLVEELEAAGVAIEGKEAGRAWEMVLAWMVPLGIVVLLWVFMARRMRGAAGQALQFGKTRAKIAVQADTGVTFADVAGCDEAKQELREVVDFLAAPGRYEKLGAKIPKGVLLVGAPGTGKTLLARAVAGESKVPFYSLSGSDFIEMFVGVGAARVRDLFEQAKRSAPCIVFIDELDAVGRRRGVHLGISNDEREQTLNALLVEMDGFEPNSGVILLGATNRPDVLDPALLRPGRFDRQVVLDSPDFEGRLAILRVHTRTTPLGPDVDLRPIAQTTAGFSGADLANTVNEAALLAARRGAAHIEQADLQEALEKVLAGPERKSRRLGDSQRRRVAYHEAGHALVSHHSRHGDAIHKISIVPRGHAALGYTMQLPTEDLFIVTKSELDDRLAGLLGGRVAEEIVFGEPSSGAADDLGKATTIAREMVATLGMSGRVGLARCAHQESTAFLPGLGGPIPRDCSETTAREIDEEVRRMLDEAKSRAVEILTRERAKLELVATTLLERETLDRAAFEALAGPSARRTATGEAEEAVANVAANRPISLPDSG